MSGRKKISKKVVEAVKRGRGRPATGRKRVSNLDVPMTAEERETLQAAADRAGLPLSRWLRELGLAAAEKSR